MAREKIKPNVWKWCRRKSVCDFVITTYGCFYYTHFVFSELMADWRHACFEGQFILNFDFFNTFLILFYNDQYLATRQYNRILKTMNSIITKILRPDKKKNMYNKALGLAGDKILFFWQSKVTYKNVVVFLQILIRRRWA